MVARSQMLGSFVGVDHAQLVSGLQQPIESLPSMCAASTFMDLLEAWSQHDGCSKDWCKSLSEDEKIRAQAFKRLPRGKPLKGTVLRRMLLEMANKYVSPEICKRLAHGWHSQNCESLHQMIHSKNPKERSQVSGHVFRGRALRSIAVKNL